MLLFFYEKGTMNARRYWKLCKDKAPLVPLPTHTVFLFQWRSENFLRQWQFGS
jgi:hypothetical protein